MKTLAHAAATATLATGIVLAGAPTALASPSAAPPPPMSSQHRGFGDGGGDCSPFCGGGQSDGSKHEKIKKFEQKLRKSIEKAIKKARDHQGGGNGGGGGCEPVC